MFGITLLELVAALKEAALAVAAASSFWIIWMGYSSRKIPATERELLKTRVIMKLKLLFELSAIFAIGLWLVTGQLFSASAHEGVTIYPTRSELAASFDYTVYGFIFLILIVVKLVYPRNSYWREKVNANPESFFIIPFLVSTFLVSFPAWRGQWDAGQWFYFGHSFHAVFTLGTVITLDYLLLRIMALEERRVFYRYLLPISAVIWVGLGMDFASSFLVLEEALILTPKFYFLQTLIGILLINGAFLAGPATAKLVTAAGGGVRLTRGWATAFSVSGAISIVSWITIKFTDFFRGLTLSYTGLLGIYAAAVIVAIVVSVSLRDREFKELL